MLLLSVGVAHHVGCSFATLTFRLLTCPVGTVASTWEHADGFTRVSEFGNTENSLFLSAQCLNTEVVRKDLKACQFV